eukprot:18874-Chlamydomonas_euryale.AAC.1
MQPGGVDGLCSDQSCATRRPSPHKRANVGRSYGPLLTPVWDDRCLRSQAVVLQNTLSAGAFKPNPTDLCPNCGGGGHCHKG